MSSLRYSGKIFIRYSKNNLIVYTKEFQFTGNRILGTPSEDSWPGVTSLQDWNQDFPVWPALQLQRFVPNLSMAGVDLLEQLIALDPRRRISAQEALDHPFLSGIIEGM